MSKKFLKQIIRDDFIYPNEKRSQYDNEIYHDINNNEPTGTIDSFDNIIVTPSVLSFEVYWTYERNNTELFQTITGGTYNIVSFHLLSPTQQDYYKPFRLIGTESTTDTSSQVITGMTSFSLTPSDVGLTEFVEDHMILEARFLGKRTVTIVNDTIFAVPVASPTPTPTPTATVGLTPTPTPTPTATAAVTPTPTPSTSITYYQEVYRCVDGTTNWWIGPFYDPFVELNPGTAIWGAVQCDPQYAYTVVGTPQNSYGTGALLGGYSLSDNGPCFSCDDQPI